MKLLQLQASAKTTWRNIKPFLFFVCSLLLLLSIVKIIFYQYNHSLLFSDGIALAFSTVLKIAAWSLLYDLLMILAINIPLLILLQIGKKIASGYSTLLLVPVFVILNSAMLLLNVMDIFYYRFHFQRANADLLFVTDHSFSPLSHFNIFIIFILCVSVIAVFYITWKLHIRLYRKLPGSNSSIRTNLVVLSAILIIAALALGSKKMLVPTYPLVNLDSRSLMIAQNSFHTFIYSIIRSGEEVTEQQYMPAAVCDSLLAIKKVLPYSYPGKKNIVLFIMESVPYDFFDSNGKYKVAMPFLDSLLNKSSFYNNAYCYYLHSNKAISAILGSVPTLTEIPIYHSQFVNIPVTQVGKALKLNGYHSFFCIGDDYDNFGFAKCSNWLGIEKYYCRQDMKVYNDKPSHSMGIHDEYVLDFMHKKIAAETQPFFAVNYNISTHYPYDLPPGFDQKLPVQYSKPMKSMLYYDHSLQLFFERSKQEDWFNNTIFIFCSDHWLAPDHEDIQFSYRNSYRIPIIIYDPMVNTKTVNNSLVSQFDLLGTILSIGGYKDSIISYGGNLLDTASLKKNTVAFCKVNSSVYQVIDSAYILGFNITTAKPDYLYHYITDAMLARNLINTVPYQSVQEELTKRIQAFLQKATAQYYHQPFK